MSKTRIVITGMGLISPLGCSVDPAWSRLISGRSGLRSITNELLSRTECKVIAPVPSINEDIYGFDVNSIIPLKEQRKMDRFIQFSVHAAKEAIEQANWFPISQEKKERTATIIGSSLGGFNAAAQSVRAFDLNGAKKLSPFTIPSFLLNLAAGHISIQYGFKGPTGAPASACAASAQAIGDGMRMILSNEVDIAICGGAEACIDPIILGSFVAARAVSTNFNKDPSKASRPFDQDRDGFILGEGAAVIVIERLDHALARGAEPIAELVGYGTSSDAHHITCSQESGDALQRSMKAAINMAQIDKSQIGYINAHGTSTPLGDRSELIAIKNVFGNFSPNISSTKSSTGHLLGAAGSLEAIFTIMALKEGILPPTLNLTTPDTISVDMNLIAQHSKSECIEYAMTNSAGFGGINASLIFKKWNQMDN